MNVLPYISVGGVEAALDSIRYTTSEARFDAMLSLALIDEYLLYHDFPQSDQRRQFALREILVDTILDRYTYLREAVLAQRYTFPANLPALREILVTDANSGNSELRTWSLLFAKYGTTLLEADTTTLEKIYSVSERSIRRYFKYGYRALADVLISKEQEARQKMHRRRLVANLPSHKSPLHIGRQRALQRLQAAYQSQIGVCLLVTGEKGIGKTHLLDVFLREQLETDNAPQHLVWLYQPKTIQGIIAHLLDQLLHDFGRHSLRDYAQMHRISLVLDSAENVLSDIPALSAQLGPVDILISATQCQNQKTLQLLYDHIHLGSLSTTETKAYIRYLQKTDDLIVDRETWHQTGNPGYIRAAAYTQLQLAPSTITLPSVLESVPAAFASRLLAAVFLPDEPIHIPSSVSVDQLGEVVKKHSGAYYVSAIERERLQSAWEAGHQHNLLHRLIGRMTSVNPPTLFASVSKHIDLAEQILFQIPNLARDRRERLLLYYWKDAVADNRLHTWQTLLETYLVDTDETNNTILYAMGVVQNSLGNRQDAVKSLETVIRDAGMDGNFALQSKAFLSLASVLRKIGQYEYALENIQRARQQSSNEGIRQGSWLQEAHIRLEAGDLARLEHCLKQVEFTVADEPSVAGLRSQLAYKRKNYQQGIEHARQLEALHPAYAHALIAQGYTFLEKVDQAENHFMHAMKGMRDFEDTYTLARVATNLAACLIRCNEWERAYALLKRAKHHQVENQDKAGLSTTEHNLRIVQKELSSIGRFLLDDHRHQ